MTNENREMNQDGGDSCGTKTFTGGSSLQGSEYGGSGEVNSMDMLKSGPSYVSHHFNDTKTFAGSYAPVEGGTHQCGGKRKKRRKSGRKSKRKKHQKKRKSVKRRKKRKH